MRGIPLRSMVVLTSMAALVAVACGNNNGNTSSSNKGTIKIGVELPESGGEATNGLPTLNGVKYAVQQQGSIDGFKLEVANKDDAPSGAHDPAVGAANIRDLVADSSVLGVIGPFNSSVAKAEIPVANQANLVMISPANTNDCLTVDVPKCSLPGGYHPQDLRPTGTNNYFRVAARDNNQGAAMADYLYDTVGVKTVGVVDDNEIYGVGIADSFAAEFCKKGGTVAGGCSGNPPSGVENSDTGTASSFTALIDKFKAEGATAIYFGGTDPPNKGCVIRNQMKDTMDPATNAFAGGDGIVEGGCLDNSKAQSVNMYGTVAAADADQIAGAQATISGIKSTYGTGNTAYGAYTIPAYAATKALIAAIGKAITDNSGNMPSRKQVLTALSNLSGVDTPLGTVKFDKNGDPVQQIISIYKTEAGCPSTALDCSTDKSFAWIFVKQVQFSS
ncbi:MAG TPA: branched-chain amino acid ABC transporter substrate-binding protein [Candidatus Dormibacteraeota bacterium]